MPRSVFNKAKRFVIILAAASLIAAFAPLHAQQPAPSTETIPSGPLLKNAPSNSQWIVAYKYDDASGKASKPTQPHSENGRVRIRQILCIRTGAMAYEMITDEAGKKTEKWFANGEQYIRKSGSSDFSSAGTKDFYNVNYEYHSPTGFPGFGWISKNKFVGIQKVLDRECLVFTDQQQELALSDPDLFAIFNDRKEHPIVKDRENHEMPIHVVNVTACIDLETRLPVLLQIGGETRTFTFLDAPTTPVVLPPELAQQLEQRQKVMEPLTRAAPHP